MRASWKGFLKLSQVSCAIALYPAVSPSERISFRSLNRDTGHRLRQEMIDEETGETVEAEARLRGFQSEQGEYITFTEDELKTTEVVSDKTIVVGSFVPRADVDELYLGNTYYVAPDGNVAAETFGILRDSMRERGVAALCQGVLFRRRRSLLIEAQDQGMRATMLRNAGEVRDAHEFFDELEDVEISGEMIDLAKHIIKTKAGHFDPKNFDDRYEDAVRALVEAKRAGEPAPPPRADQPSNVVNLMDALRRSAGSSTPPAKSRGHGPRRSHRTDTD